MVQALKKWKHYLLQKEFIVYTDNHAPNFLNRQDKINHRNVKWVEKIQAFTFSIKHKNGTINKVADALRKRILEIQEVKLQSVGLE